jgi:hypothetical protein
MTPSGGDDDITTGELSRSVAALRSDINQRFTELASTIQQHVSMQLYQAEMTSLRAEVARLQARADAADQERDKWRLAIFTAIVAPLVVALITGGLILKGVH